MCGIVEVVDETAAAAVEEAEGLGSGGGGSI